MILAAALVSGLVTVSGLLFCEVVDYADFRADRFGVPYYWIEHVSMTFAGSTNRWNIIIENLAKNIAAYFVACFAVLSLILVRKPKTKDDQK